MGRGFWVLWATGFSHAGRGFWVHAVSHAGHGIFTRAAGLGFMGATGFSCGPRALGSSGPRVSHAATGFGFMRAIGVQNSIVKFNG